jgi:hypothetical protein
MKNKRTPTSIIMMLVGVVFLFAYPQGGSADLFEQRNLSLEDVQQFHSAFVSHNASAMQHVMPGSLKISTLAAPKEESISLNGSQSLQGVVSLNTERHRDLSFNGNLGQTSPGINYMDIEVSRITVIAINTANGGKAVATSEVVLQPVQNSGCSCCPDQLVQEKLG